MIGLPLLLLLGTPPLPTSVAADVERYAQAYAALLDAKDEKETALRARGVSRRIDTMVVHALNAGLPLREVGKLLLLPDSPHSTSGKPAITLSAERFRTELPDDPPPLALRPLPGPGPERILGVYSLGAAPENQSGEISLYTRTPAGWKVTGRFMSPLPLGAACLADGDACARIVAVETFT